MIKLFLLLASVITLSACGVQGSSGNHQEETLATNTETQKIRLIESVYPSYRHSIPQGGTLTIGYKPTGAVDSAKIWVANRLIATMDSTPTQVDYTVDREKVGKRGYTIEVFRSGESQRMPGQFTITAAKAPKRAVAKVVKTYHHDPKAYTQGLLYHNGKLYESTGQYGTSSLREVNISDGKVDKQIDLESKYFGEGLALLDGKLYQLTWMEQTCMVYDLKDFGPIKQFTYPGEGWGITTDGESLYVSNGSEKITRYNPETFKAQEVIEVYDNSGALVNINEMEWIDGKIWANIYTTDNIIIIDPHSGCVTTIIDCSALPRMIGNPQTADVLNGIAHDPATGRIWVTGKDWDKLFEIKI